MTTAEVTLSARELQVVELVAEGLTNEEIGGRLGIEMDTVRTHLVNMSKRLGGVRSRAAVVHWAWKHGLLGNTIDEAALLAENADLRDAVDRLGGRISELCAALDDLEPGRGAKLYAENEAVRKVNTELAVRIEELTNTVDNLQAMYETAVRFQGWQPKPALS